MRSLREAGSAIPVLLLTARGSVSDKVAGLDLGADDYMTKPFALAELQARIRSLTRRKGAMAPAVLTCADLIVKPTTHQAFRGERELSLTAKEFALLQYLAVHCGTVVTHTDIIEKVWDVNFDVFSDVLKVMISRLRRKLEAGGEGPLIHTVRGVGYILKEPTNGHAAKE